MAHAAKYQRRAIAHMLAHYERKKTKEKRKNIDAKRTHLNYSLGLANDGEIMRVDNDRLADHVKQTIRWAEDMHARNEEFKAMLDGRKPQKLRANAALMADWVITLPEDCPPDRAEDFFRATIAFVQMRYKGAVVCGGFVHLDEKEPHMHIPFIPLDEDGRFNAWKVVSRKDLRSFHKDLQKHLENEGIPGHVHGRRRKDRPKFASRLKKEDLQEFNEMFDDYQEAVRAAEKLPDIERELQTVKEVNEGLEGDLRAIEDALGLSDFIYDEKKETIRDAALHYREVMDAQIESLLKDRRELRQMKSERQTDARKDVAAQPVRPEVHRKQPAQPVVEARNDNDAYDPW